MKDDRKYTEAHVTLVNSNVRSTFQLSSKDQMLSMHHLVAGYISDKYSFTVTYS